MTAPDSGAEMNAGASAGGATVDGGVRAARVHDSAAKHVSGAAIYTDDIPEPPGTLQVYLARSERAHARIVSMPTWMRCGRATALRLC